MNIFTKVIVGYRHERVAINETVDLYEEDDYNNAGKTVLVLQILEIEYDNKVKFVGIEV